MSVKILQKILLSTVLLILGSFSMSAQEPHSAEALFQQANEAYQKDDFKTASALYNRIVKAGEQSPELFLNFGNAWLKQDSIAQAVLAYEKGLFIAPLHKELLHNRQIARAKVVLKAPVYPEMFYKRVLRKTILQLKSWQWLLLGVVLNGLLLWLFNKFIYKRKRRLFVSGLFCFILSLFCLISFFIKYNWETDASKVVLFGEEVEVKSAPSETSDTQFMLSDGNVLFVNEILGEWSRVDLEDGQEGWVASKYLVKVNTP